MIIIYFITILFGLSVGSFLNCMAWRLYTEKTIFGRSMCPQCGHQLAWHDNIPLLSFLILRGKCRYCQKKISWQYFLVELATASLFVLAVYYNPAISQLNFNFHSILLLLRDWFLISAVVIIFIMDLNWQIIVDKVSIPAIIIIFVFNILLGFSWQNILLAGIIGGGLFLLQFIITRARGVGGGDIRMGLLMGVALGYPQILTALFIAYILGAAIGLTIVIVQRKGIKGAKIAFGTFLGAGTIMTLFWGESLLHWYLNIIHF